jgi:hypothetical protein
VERTVGRGLGVAVGRGVIGGATGVASGGPPPMVGLGAAVPSALDAWADSVGVGVGEALGVALSVVDACGPP